MTAKFLNQSKYKHVFSTTSKREQSYELFKFSRSSTDNPLCVVNPTFLAFVSDCGGGGAFVVVPLSRTGRVPVDYPHVAAHTADILDISFYPFDDKIIASCSEDTTIKVWELPKEEMTENLLDPLVCLERHTRKVLQILWHPTASFVILSIGADRNIFIWDVATADVMFSLVDEHPELIFCASWNLNGDLLVTSCRDCKIRVWDVRKPVGKQLLACTPGKAHENTRQLQVKFAKDDRIISTGFTKTTERQVAVWDRHNLNEGPVTLIELDQTNGVLFIIYDPDTNLVYLVGKGDSTIRFFEMRDPKEASALMYLNQQSFPDPHKGVAVMPKRAMNFRDCEVMRLYRIVLGRKVIEPTIWAVPRKSVLLQKDIYPPTASNSSSISAADWQAGESGKITYVDISTYLEEEKPAEIEHKDGTLSKRAETFFAKAQARAKRDADEKFGPVTETSRSKSRDDSGDHSANRSSSRVSTPDSSGEVTRLTLIVKGHEARIKMLEENLKSLEERFLMQPQVNGS